MDEQERQRLAIHRKRWLEHKKLKKEVAHDAEIEDQRNRLEQFREQYENKYAVAAITLFGTILPLYFFLFLGLAFLDGVFILILGLNVASALGLPQAWLTLMLHLLVWTAGIISVIRGRSVLEDLYDAW